MIKTMSLDIAKQKEGIKEEIKQIRGAFVAKVLALMIGGFGLVAALAWNAAIQTLVKSVFGDKSGGIIAKFIYALLVTGLLAIVSIKIGREEQKK